MKKRVLKLVMNEDIAIPLTPRERVKAKIMVMGICRIMAKKLHHINGQVVPLLRKWIRIGWRRLLAIRSGIENRQYRVATRVILGFCWRISKRGSRLAHNIAMGNEVKSSIRIVLLRVI